MSSLILEAIEYWKSLPDVCLLHSVSPIAPGESRLVEEMRTGRSVEPLSVYLIEIPDTIANHFLIDDILVGGKTQFAGDVPVPAIVFSEGVQSHVRLDILYGTIVAQMKVSNISEEPCLFVALLRGNLIR